MTWTLEELAERAARALVDADVRVANGRVTGVPDGRLIRWYATIGLVDRPALGPGRVARYGVRHLRQLVAVKRLQAQGLPLTEIQHRLAGATDATLRAVAALPPGLEEATEDLSVQTDRVVGLRDPSNDGDHATGDRATGDHANGDHANGDHAEGDHATGDHAGDLSAGEEEIEGPGRRLTTPKPSVGATPEDGVSAADAPSQRGREATRFWAARPGEAPTATARGPGLDTGGDTVTRVYGVRINGLTLLLPAPPAEDDLDAIRAAARPLLELLAERGLLDHRMADEIPRRGAPE